MNKSSVLLFIFASTLLNACSGGAPSRHAGNAVTAPAPELSTAEQDYLKSHGGTVAVALLHPDGTLETRRVGTSDVLAHHEEWAKDSVVALDLPVLLNDAPALPDEGLLFGGKEVFEVAAWEAAHPQADGRGVKIAVVDDGVTENRPGLLTTSTGAPKIARHLNMSPLWQLPLRDSYPDGCATGTGVPAPTTAAQSAAWVMDTALVPAQETFTRSKAFDLTPCGINPELTRRPRKCMGWGRFFTRPVAATKANEDVLRLAALYAESPTGVAVLVDFNSDGRITDDDVLIPWSQPGRRGRQLPDGSTLGVDIANTADLLSPTKPALDHPLRGCLAGVADPEKTLLLTLPELQAETGSHGEGVASIAAGHRIAGRPFDGMAPGAQVIDVHFGDSFGGRSYTIAEVARALKAGGKQADIVNLSYSLFFPTAAAQAAMGRLLEAYLADTDAAYFFSAGNNGPGRGSMNRGLLYPSFGVVVGAYLEPLLSQTTFGSPVPIGGVVTYSSRGPGPDGASGPFVISPLAGMAASTVDGGIQPFSGTSSATPALAGFSARLAGQIRADGLPFKRNWLRQALAESARPLDGVAFVDQGYGLPRLLPALAAYRRMAGAASNLTPAPATLRPLLDVSGPRGATGLPQRGIFVRGDRDRFDQVTFTIRPQFDEAVPAPLRGNYAESLRIESDAPWAQVAQASLIGPGGTRITIALDWDRLGAMGPGEYLATVRLINVDDGTLRAVIPVTVVTPQVFATAATAPRESTQVIDIPAGGLQRVALDRPEGGRYLLASVESADPVQPLCGGLKWYDPTGVRVKSQSFAADGGTLRSDQALAAASPGVYELTLEGRGNHVACARSQRWSLRLRWAAVEVSASAGNIDTQGRTVAQVQASTPLPGALSGKLALRGIAETRGLEFTQSADGGQTWALAQPLDLSAYARATFAFEAATAARFTAGYSYPLYTLFIFDGVEELQPQTYGLPAAGEDTESLRVEKPDDYRQLHLALQGFQDGLTAEGLVLGPLALRAYLRSDRLTAAYRAPDPIAMTLRRGTPVMVPLIVPALVDATNAALSCEFLPDGFEVALPCGWVQVR